MPGSRTLWSSILGVACSLGCTLVHPSATPLAPDVPQAPPETPARDSTPDLSRPEVPSPDHPSDGPPGEPPEDLAQLPDATADTFPDIPLPDQTSTDTGVVAMDTFPDIEMDIADPGDVIPDGVIPPDFVFPDLPADLSLPDLVVPEVPPTDVPPGLCGRTGQRCCGTGTCSGGAQCLSDPPLAGNFLCRACGAPGEVCCGYTACGPGARCLPSLEGRVVCTACGGFGQLCCPGSTCGGARTCYGVLCF